MAGIIKPIGRTELLHAQAALLVAVTLQFTLSDDLVVGPQYVVALLQLVLIFAIGITAPRRHKTASSLHRTMALLLIALVSLINTISLGTIINELVHGQDISGLSLLTSAVGIYFTNIIVFALWYWEIDSPGLTGYQHHAHKPSFLFPQSAQNTDEARSWRPTFFDYLYTSLTNGTAFSPTDTLPLTHGAKFLMGIQALVSLLTIVLVTARAVNILGS